MSILVRAAEQQYLHVKRGNLDPIFSESAEKLNREWLRLTGVQRWWTNNKEILSHEFATHMETQLQAAADKGHVSSFTTEPEAPSDAVLDADK